MRVCREVKRQYYRQPRANIKLPKRQQNQSVLLLNLIIISHESKEEDAIQEELNFPEDSPFEVTKHTLPGVDAINCYIGYESYSLDISTFLSEMNFDLFNNLNPSELETDDIELPEIVDVPQSIPEDPRKQIRHSVVFPPNQKVKRPIDFSQPIYELQAPKIPAKTFPFVLDPFQQKSVAALERGDSILVSAHTSAGKTAVAEYAIALALQKGEKIAYTTPIKALSNQKFRDLTLMYSNNENSKISVGLLTGDSTVNKKGQIIVMTTEILRNMLEEGAELLRELGCVIFDEVHYMRNAERGVVWEDCISQLDKRCVFVFLSATIPNATEFAGWVSRVQEKPIHVIYTEYRPVPLEFCICPLGGREVYQIFNSDTRVLNELNIQKARQSLPFIGGKQGSLGGKEKQKLLNETIMNCLTMLKSKYILPVIVFSFGKARCEELAELCSQNDEISTLLSAKEQETVELIFNAALKELDEEDRHLKQVVGAKQLLKKGIAVHHSGLLPFVKELTEILFEEDLIKIIFVTETFAMGLNLPARCVIFSDMQKFDGVNNRYLQSGEFIEMAGRSGRRGKDTEGLVISFFSGEDDCTETLKVMQGGAEPLNSVYRIGYCQLLNYLRTEGLSAEDAIKRSFLEFQREFRLPRCSRQLENIDIALLEYEKEYSELCELPLDEMLEYLDIEELLFNEEQTLEEMHKDAELTALLKEKLVRGRLVKITGDQMQFGWGVVLNQFFGLKQLTVDCLIPGIAPPAYNPRKNSGDAAIELCENSVKKISPADDYVENLLKQSDYSSFVTQPSNDTLDDVLQENEASLLGVSDAEFLRPDLQCCDAFINAFQRGKTIVRNDLYCFLMNRAGQAVTDSSLFDSGCYEPIVVKVPISCISAISKYYLKNLPVSHVNYDDRRTILTKLTATFSKLWESFDGQSGESKYANRHDLIPIMSYDQLPGIQLKYVEQQGKVLKLEALLKSQFKPQHEFFNRYGSDEKLKQLTPILLELQKLKRRQHLLTMELERGAFVLSQDLQAKNQFLEENGYFDFKQRQICEKGRIAAEINAVNEVIITEALFQGVFKGCGYQQVAAIVASLLGERINENDEVQVDELIEGKLNTLAKITEKLLETCSVLQISLEEEKTRADEIIDFKMAQSALMWANGTNLEDILDEIKGQFEGNLVRNFRRLVTALEQIQQAVSEWEGGEFAGICGKAMEAVNRGVVRAASLYIVEEADAEEE